MLSFVVLIIVGCLSGGVWSCSCAPGHPQTAFCDSPVVIRAKFIERTNVDERRVRYKIKTTKIYKAPGQMTDIQYLYTPNMESVCGFLPPSINKTKEFLITGHGDEEQILINSCGFIRPWDSLTASQKQGFQQVYEKNCACRIVPCYGTCETTSSNQCLWTDMLMNRKSQSEDMACVQFGDNMCRWDYLKSRLFTTISKLKSR